MKIQVVKGPQKRKEFEINKESIIIGRQDRKVNWYPDVDLTPDWQVSGKQARIWREYGQYWIEDLGSKNGTWVGAQKIRDKMLLEPGVEFKVGKSILMIELPNRVCGRYGGLMVEFSFCPVVNYSLIHCEVPSISNLTIRNEASSPSIPGKLSFYISEYTPPGGTVVEVPAIEQGARINIGDVSLNLDPIRLDGQIEKDRAELLVKFEDEIIARRNLFVLAYSEFSLEPESEHQVSLASFVQPRHPLVQQIVSDTSLILKDLSGVTSFEALRDSQRPDRFDRMVETVYQCLQSRYYLDYVEELSWSPEERIQKVRLAHDVLTDPELKRGQGTCIDLSVLMAACLENKNIGLQPLVLLIEDGAHALVGCWRGETEEVEPLLLDKQYLLEEIQDSGKLLVLECTGLTKGKRRLNFTESISVATERLSKSNLLFALDICAARRYGGKGGIDPLPFTGDPQLPEAVKRILKQAASCASKNNSGVLGAPHILFGLVAFSDSLMRDILLKQGLKHSEVIKDKIAKGVRGKAKKGVKPKPTPHYRQVISLSCAIARSWDRASIEECHLIEALLEVRSSALDKALRCLGTNRQRCLEQLHSLTGSGSSFSSTESFFGSE